MNWFDALDIADGFWGDSAELNDFCAFSQLPEGILDPYISHLSADEMDPSSSEIGGASVDKWVIPLLGEREDPKAKRRMRWTVGEDALLEKLAQKFKNDWMKIAEKFPYHPLASVQKRWRKKFDPKTKKTRWTPEEDSLIVRLFEIQGGNWIKISKSIPGRHPEAIKNRFYGTLRKRLSADHQERLAIRIRSNADNLKALMQHKKQPENLLTERLIEATNDTFSGLSCASTYSNVLVLDKNAKRAKIQALRDRMVALESFLSSTKTQISRIEKEFS